MDMSCTVGLGAGGEGVEGREEKEGEDKWFRKPQFT